MPGLFKLHDTHGVSLTNSVAHCLENYPHISPDFYQFILDAKAAGWLPRKIYTVIRETVVDNGLDREAILPKVELVLDYKFEGK